MIQSSELPKLFGLRLLPEIPALIINHVLVVADLHIGSSTDVFRYSPRARWRITSYQVSSMLHAISSITKGSLDRLIILGDVKENIGMPRKFILDSIYGFFSKIRGLFRKVIVVRGNHDGKLLEILDEFDLDVEIADYVILHSKGKYVALTHGHMKLPGDDYTKSTLIITGHLHPATDLDKPFVISNYKTDDVEKTVIIVPALNPKIWGTAIDCRAVQGLLKTVTPLEFQRIQVREIDLIGKTTREKITCLR